MSINLADHVLDLLAFSFGNRLLAVLQYSWFALLIDFHTVGFLVQFKDMDFGFAGLLLYQFGSISLGHSTLLMKLLYQTHWLGTGGP